MLFLCEPFCLFLGTGPTNVIGWLTVVVWSGDLRVHFVCSTFVSHFFGARSSLTHFVLLDRLTHFAGVQRSSLAWVMLGSSYSVYKLPARLRFLHSGRCKAES